MPGTHHQAVFSVLAQWRHGEVVQAAIGGDGAAATAGAEGPGTVLRCSFDKDKKENSTEITNSG